MIQITITPQRERLHLAGEIKNGLQTHGLCIVCQNSQSSRFNDITSFKPVPQLLQSIIHINLAYILVGLNVSPEIQNIEKQNLRAMHDVCTDTVQST